MREITKGKAKNKKRNGRKGTKTTTKTTGVSSSLLYIHQLNSTNARKTSEEDEQIKREKELKAMYRDRTKERQKGLAVDYDQSEVEISKKVSIEHSKFLGGDVTRTHLVKGLDFTLLHKVRDRMKGKLKQNRDESSSSSVVHKPASELKFNSIKASNLYRELTRPETGKVKTFMSGRTSIIFHLDNSDDDEDYEEKPPTLVACSKRFGDNEVQDDQQEDTFHVDLSDEFLNQIKKSISNAKNKKKARLERNLYSTTTMTTSSRSQRASFYDDDDDDFEIFPGAGKWKPGM